MSGITCPSCGTFHNEPKKFCFKCGYNFSNSESSKTSIPTETTTVAEASKTIEAPLKSISVNFGNPLKSRKTAGNIPVNLDQLNSAIPNITTFIPHSFAQAKWQDGLQAALAMISVPVGATLLLIIYLSTQQGANVTGSLILGLLGSIISLTFGGQLTGGDAASTGSMAISFLPSAITILSMLILSRKYKKHLKSVSVSSNVELFTDLLLFLIPSFLLVLISTLLFRGNLSVASNFSIRIVGSVGGALFGFTVFSFVSLILGLVCTSEEIITLGWIQTSRQFLLIPMWALRRGFLAAMAFTLISFTLIVTLSSARSSFLSFFVIIVLILPTLTLASIGLSTFSPVVSSSGSGSSGSNSSLSLNTLASFSHAFWVLPIVIVISLLLTTIIMILRRNDARVARRDGGVLVGLIAIGVIFVLIVVHIQISGDVSALGLSFIPNAKETISGIAIIMIPLAAGIAWVCSGLILNRASHQTLSRWSQTVRNWK